MQTPVSHATHISATVFFKHKYITNPTVTPADAIIAATANLSHVLMSNTAATHLNDLQLADITQLQKIIQVTPTSIKKPFQQSTHTNSSLTINPACHRRYNPSRHLHTQLFQTLRVMRVPTMMEHHCKNHINQPTSPQHPLQG
jgi:G3E family GTPase